MEQVQGLKEYVKLEQYRKALGLPEEVTETYEMLAQGEYNRNYIFTHPVTKKKLILRVNFGSQMHLENQEVQEKYTYIQSYFRGKNCTARNGHLPCAGSL